MIEDIHVKISCNLWAKKINVNGNEIEVYGLGSYRTFPKRSGLGRYGLRGIEEVARKNGVYAIVAFCDDEVLPFYLKFGWYKCGYFQDHHVISSLPLLNVTPTELW